MQARPNFRVDFLQRLLLVDSRVKVREFGRLCDEQQSTIEGGVVQQGSLELRDRQKRDL